MTYIHLLIYFPFWVVGELVPFSSSHGVGGGEGGGVGGCTLDKLQIHHKDIKRQTCKFMVFSRKSEYLEQSNVCTKLLPERLGMDPKTFLLWGKGSGLFSAVGKISSGTPCAICNLHPLTYQIKLLCDFFNIHKSGCPLKIVNLIYLKFSLPDTCQYLLTAIRNTCLCLRAAVERSNSCFSF